MRQGILTGAENERKALEGVIDLELSPASRRTGRAQIDLRVEDFAPELGSKYFVSMQGALQERYLERPVMALV